MQHARIIDDLNDEFAVEELEPINAPGILIDLAIGLIGFDIGMLIAFIK